MNNIVDNRRIRQLNSLPGRPGPVLYWMSRDMRVQDNWALLYAQQKALEAKSSMAVLFCLVPEFQSPTLRRLDFVIKGLKEIERDLLKLNIPLYFLTGSPEKVLLKFINENNIFCLVTDFSPLRIKQKWNQALKAKLNIPFYEVDAHNIVPCWIASDKKEYAAYTIRPKITNKLPDYLTEFPKLKKNSVHWPGKLEKIDWSAIVKRQKVDRSIMPIDGLISGKKAAIELCNKFISAKLANYENDRNDPNKDGQSNLSPYINFGHISAQRIVLQVQKKNIKKVLKESFLEELIVRRELSDNFCYYEPDYDSFNGFHNWAQTTLNGHRNDKREYLYTTDQFEQAKTHDELWNAAQNEMIITGKMHGFMRMYWAKKILEWSESPESALKTAIYLNDKYELDGCDPNGFAGVAWSIGGIHDRAWSERPVFGKIRYMNLAGCKRKFKVQEYIDRINSLK